MFPLLPTGFPNRQHEIEEHTQMLDIRKKSIAKTWHKRYDKEYRETLKWLVEQAQFHKHMIAQLNSLGDLNWGIDF